MTHTTKCHRCGGGTGQDRPCDCAIKLRRLRGLLESVKLKRYEGKHLKLWVDELPGLEDALVAALQEHSA